MEFANEKDLKGTLYIKQINIIIEMRTSSQRLVSPPVGCHAVTSQPDGRDTPSLAQLDQAPVTSVEEVQSASAMK